MIFRSKRSERINEILTSSTMSICGTKDKEGNMKRGLIRISGAAAKVPSTTNSRMITIHRNHILSKIEFLLQNPDKRQMPEFVALRKAVANLRPQITKNPAQHEMLMAMGILFDGLTQNKKFKFDVSDKQRGLVIMLLSPQLNRHDTHNIPKAVCDWLQEKEIISNDRYVDVVARRKTDMQIFTDSTDIYIQSYTAGLYEASPFGISLSVDHAMGSMFKMIQNLEGNNQRNPEPKKEAQPTQQTFEKLFNKANEQHQNQNSQA